MMNDASQREDWPELGRLTGLLLADRPVPAPQEIADEQAAWDAHWQGVADQSRAGQHEKVREEHARLQRAIPKHGNAAALQCQPGGAPSEPGGMV